MARTRLIDSEPKFVGEMSSNDINKALGWYTENRDKKDAIKYASEYLKRKHGLIVGSAIKNKTRTFGFMCRIVSNGGILSEEMQTWFDKEIQNLKDSPADAPVVEESSKNVINIQDRIREKSSECIGEIEGMIDDLIESDFKSNFSPYAVFHKMEIKAAHIRHVLEVFKKRRSEFDQVLNSKDEDLKEGYSNFSKTQLKKLIAFCDEVILDCGKITESSMKNRKPRKRKAKTPDQIVSKVKICQEFKELNLKSIDVRTVIGATQLWVYNTKYRKLGCYHANDAGGFIIKGTKILNFNETKSTQKKLRKPEVTLPEILKASKVTSRNFMEAIRAVESPLNGRLTADIVLLRIVK